MVKLETMPKSSVPDGAFTSFKDVADRWVKKEILQGEAIIEKKLAPKGSPAGLIARIPKGMRAFTINVNEQTGVSGFIQPDHRVDVFQVQTSENGQQARAIPVLQDVLVLASGTSTQSSNDRSTQARTVTVAVTPENAAILTMAQSRGTLSLALRSINDHELATFPEPPPPDAARAARARAAQGACQAPRLGPARGGADTAARDDLSRRQAARADPRGQAARRGRGRRTRLPQPG